jgi:selenocysteine-specific elongation factor
MADPSARATEPPLHVVTTAGHVDHGKSSLIAALTGMDPDRLAEEKRRGLTIDLGFAWCTLPGGHEIGFVDVPGHERFVRTMLAGVGPVRLVLFVVAADEGWKPQSEEHLAIVDVLGVDGAVVALTKRDLVDPETVELAAEEIRERLVGTALERTRIVPCSAVTGEGLPELVATLDAMVEAAPRPAEDDRPRLFVDRAFTIRGAGTVVTGTLAGGRLAVGEEVELHPPGRRARIRGLQTHKRAIEVARPVSRVAVNLAGVERADLERGDVLAPPGLWRPTSVLEARIRPVRGLAHPLTARGAFSFHAGSAERDARLRPYGSQEVGPDGAFARIRLSAPVVLDVGDRFVLRESGRRETVAGGVVLDVEPPARPGADPSQRLTARAAAGAGELPALVIAERGAARDAEVRLLAGRSPEPDARLVRAGAWWVSQSLHASVAMAVRDHLEGFHDANPLRPGEELGAVRTTVEAAVRRERVPAEPELVDALLDDLDDRGELQREGPIARLPSHRASLAGHEEELDRLVAAVASAEPTPPTVNELLASGFSPEVLDAATREGPLVRVSREIVLTAAFVERALDVVREAGAAGVTVSALREALGTSRKYAVPLLEHLDGRRLTRRVGDVRVAREASSPS